MDEYFVEEKSSWDKLLDFLVFLAVFAVTVFLILEIVAQTGRTSIDIVQVNDIYFYINIVVFLIFVADLVRLWKASENASEFFKHGWLDILATIPFGLMGSLLSNYTILNAFKWARVAKLGTLAKAQKISRISKISKEFKAASHLKKEGEEYQKKHRL